MRKVRVTFAWTLEPEKLNMPAMLATIRSQGGEAEIQKVEVIQPAEPTNKE